VKASTGVFAIINLCEDWQWFRNLKILNESSISARGENHQSSGDCRNAKLKNIILGLTVANAKDSR